MNYRHAYHAGNRADVFKHFILTLLLQKLAEKPSPFVVLDSHAGIGAYDLSSIEAQKTREAEAGILALLAANPTAPSLQPYLQQVRGAALYPGSPALARAFLRPNDRLILCELHAEDVHRLKKHFHRDGQTNIHHRDGYEALGALLPPPEKRGLILVDPPFEQDNEFSRMAESLSKALARFRQGIFALWYPIKGKAAVEAFMAALHTMALPEALRVEWLFFPTLQPDRLNGCGMVILNPPWQLEIALNEGLAAIVDALKLPESRWDIQHLPKA
jgi:23S rRNA (adenine2030-N6)-methyltransferase